MDSNQYIVKLKDPKGPPTHLTITADYGDVLACGALVFQNGAADEKDNSVDEVFALAPGEWAHYYKYNPANNCPTNVEGLIP